MQGQYNMRSPAVKRLMKEAQELNEPTELYHAQPLEDNLFEWHFTLRGPEDSEFEGGIYHGRIILPPDYPMKPPSIILLTPNGRFETFKKICLSISGHHPESWQPSWSIRTALLALIGFMPTHGGGAIGSLDYTPEERKVLAKKSQDWKCPDCGVVTGKLKPVTKESEKVSQEAKALASQINFQGEKKGGNTENQTSDSSAGPTTSAPTTVVATATSNAHTTLPPNTYPFPWGVPPPLALSTTLGTSGGPGNVWANQASTGGMAYPRFPYPPPFMMPLPPGMTNQAGGQQGTQPQMPMFPPPPMPFFPPMFQGFPPFPGQPGAAVSSANSSAAASSQVSSGVAAASAPAAAATAVSAAGTTTTTAAAATRVSHTASSPGSSATSPQTSTTETVGAATAVTTATSVGSPTSSAAATSTPSTPATTTTTTSELRQRQTNAAQAPAAPSQPAATRNAPVTHHRGQDSQNLSLIIMAVVAFLIGLLLARRVYVQFYSPHYRGIMD